MRFFGVSLKIVWKISTKLTFIWIPIYYNSGKLVEIENQINNYFNYKLNKTLKLLETWSFFPKFCYNSHFECCEKRNPFQQKSLFFCIIYNKLWIIIEIKWLLFWSYNYQWEEKITLIMFLMIIIGSIIKLVIMWHLYWVHFDDAGNWNSIFHKKFINLRRKKLPRNEFRFNCNTLNFN